MSASVHQLPTRHQPTAEPVSHDRAGFGALRAELHSRCADSDLAQLWSELAIAERRTLLASAHLDKRLSLDAIASMSKGQRHAIRAAIQRMSQYAERLRVRLAGDKPHPSRELASHARQALAEGNTKAAMHWLSLIERGVA